MSWNLEQIISHRGASAYAPENTLNAFQKAFDLGSRSIEFDVMLSADNQAFIFHDTDISRTTNGKGKFGLLSSDFIKTLDAGSWFNQESLANDIIRIPTFEEIILWLNTVPMHANVEIKPYPGYCENTTIQVINTIDKFWSKNKPYPLISSFDINAMRLSQKLAPHLPRGLLLHRWKRDVVEIASDLDCISIHLNKNIATESRINYLKQEGYFVCVYTVDQKNDAENFLSLGVDSIFSNDPNVLKL